MKFAEDGVGKLAFHLDVLFLRDYPMAPPVRWAAIAENPVEKELEKLWPELGLLVLVDPPRLNEFSPPG